MIARPLRLLALLSVFAVPTARADEPGPPLDLDALVQEALAHHPAEARVQAQAEAAAELASQVASPPDPMLSFGASNLRMDDPGLTTSPMSGLVLGLNQGLPYPGKLLRQRDVAERAADVALGRVASTEAMIALRVSERYWWLHFTEQALQITGESIAILDNLADAITARFGVGQAAQQDALQVQVAEGRLRSVLEARAQAVVSAQRDLESAVGRAPNAALGTTGAMIDAPSLDAEAALQELRERNPDLAVARSRAQVAEAAVRRAKADFAPDLGVGVSWRLRDAAPGDLSNGADMVSAGLSVSLPVWAAFKQSAALRQERASARAADADVADVALALETQLGVQIDRVQRLTAEIDLHRVQLLPQSDSALDASINDYMVGDVGFISVLTNWQVTLDLQLMLESLLSDRARSLARIDALLGATPTAEETSR